MIYDDVPELHLILPTENLASVLERGILTHNQAQDVSHSSVALEEVQDRRREKEVPGGWALHDYANLYFHARNPMLYRRKEDHAGLCILSIRREALKIPGVVIADCNASSDYVRFGAFPDGLAGLDKDRLYARDWRHPDRIEHLRHKSEKCAEVLVPGGLPPRYIRAAYVSCPATEANLSALFPSLRLKISPDLFFLL